MGLFDFLNKGEEKPVTPANQPAPQADNTDFFGANASTDTAAATQSETYTVVSGDSLSKIAKHHYGDASKWHQIYDANKGTIGNNPDNIEVGQVLQLPKM